MDLLHIPRHQSSRGHKFLIRIHRPIIRLQQLAQQLLRILRQQGLISVEIRWVVHRHLHHSYRNILQQQQPCLLVEMDKTQDQQVRFRRAQAFHHLKYHLVHLNQSSSQQSLDSNPNTAGGGDGRSFTLLSMSFFFFSISIRTYIENSMFLFYYFAKKKIVFDSYLFV